MDAPTISTDSKAGGDHGKTPVSSGLTALTGHSGKIGSYPVQTFSGSQTMNSHNSGSTAVTEGSTSESGQNPMSKGLISVVTPPTSNSVIQTPVMTSQNVVQPMSQAAGPTVTLARPPMQSGRSGMNLNGDNNVTPSTSCQAGTAVQTSVLNNNQPTNSVTVSTGLHVIKAEPPQAIQTSSQLAVIPGTPRNLGTVAAGQGGVRALTPQALAPRLPQTSPGQPSVHNIQIPPGMVLVQSESGQLLMIPQQALAQVQAQAQAQAQAQGGGAPRTATPTNVSPVQAPGGTVISKPVAPSTIIHQGCPAPTSLPATTTLHRPPVLQSSIGASGTITRTINKTAGTTVTTVTMSKETIENVKKCKNFLSTLMKLASTGKQSPETAALVRELVKDLLDGKLEAEEFTGRLYKELNSSPQPYLVPFLMRSLPALRQLTPDSTAFIQQSQLPQPSSAPVTSASPISSTVVLGSPAPRLPVPVNRPQFQPGVTKLGQTTSLVLQPQQQRAVLRPQVPLATTPMVTLRNPAPGHMVLGQQRVQLKDLQPGPVRPLASKQVSATALTPAQKNQLKEAGGTFKDDDDINDVASMAGVNLSEESANILATNSELVGVVTHSCKDEAFLSTSLLQRRILEIGRKYGVTDLGAEVVKYVSHATQQRLQNLLEKVSLVAQQRHISFKIFARLSSCNLGLSAGLTV
ncbi:transcription initiation factor TFIID subunit 4 isoform X2 [Takifugu flavidus]|uniref:transcription initiation factor TFIID subunit 4 isoform X2 n=1 Tax=Takifugu flavidus TaxID=433684 RepID=UPI002544788B|nr:transcription initiation factor TFIID subunit 4 isoform X2 [Takifugu flavidus]